MVSLTRLQEIPPKSMILLVGPPGAGKSTFCHQTVLNNIETRPIVYVTTESAPSKVADLLMQKGLGGALPHTLSFVDAFHETVGLQSVARPDTVKASSEDLTNLGIAISKLGERVEEDFLLIFDSLTPPYLLSGSDILRFMRMTLLRLAAEGNAVLACVDEGCGKEEDLVAMMSTVDGIIKIELMDSSRTFNVMKHPRIQPIKIEVPMTWSPHVSYDFDIEMLTHHMERCMGLMAGPPLRREVGDYVNIFWSNFTRWSGMLWDPKRFPTMTYDSNEQVESMIRASVKFLPWRARLSLRLFMPKNFSKVKDMKKLMAWCKRMMEGDRSYIIEYLEDSSKTDEHYLRGYECATCWGFENVGAALGLGALGWLPGVLEGFEKEDRDWNALETKCVGLGDPYCEVKLVPGEVDGLKESLEAVDSAIIERIHGRLMDRLIGFMLNKKPLWERPKLGNEISLHAFGHITSDMAATASERYRMAMRLGGVLGGKEVGERLLSAGMKEDEAVHHVINLLEHCKVGKVSIDETIKIRENCESFMIKAQEPSCFFTTGFLNGFFSAVKSQHVRETKCLAVGDPHCEWQFR